MSTEIEGCCDDVSTESEYDMFSQQMFTCAQCSLNTVEGKRIQFTEALTSKESDPYVIRRSRVYEDVVSLYRTHSAVVLFDKSFSVEYAGEKAIDAGGVTRDVFSAFWESAYLEKFDGGGVLTPEMSPHDDPVVFSVLGSIPGHCQCFQGNSCRNP